MMKKLLFVFALSASLMACKNDKKEPKEAPKPAPKVEKPVAKPKQPLRDGVYQFNNAASTLMWKGSKPTGSHNGTVALKEGIIQVKSGKLMGGEFTFDMNNMEVKDIPKTDEGNAKLLGHLQSADFFGVKEHPTATFVIKEVVGDMLQGDLTIKGIKQPVSFKYKLSGEDRNADLMVEPTKIDRTKYNIKYKSKTFFKDLADKFIDDEFEVSFDGKAMFVRTNMVEPKPMPKPERMTKSVYFSSAMHSLSRASMMELDKIASMMKTHELNSLKIEGHADNVGPDDYNQGLSEKRAMAVKNYLIKKGVPSSKVSTMSYGETRPAASNDTNQGRMKNRRSEVMITMTKKQ